jgi:hypothetical protein
MDPNALAAMDDRLDRLVNIDVGNRGIEPLYATAREQQGQSLVGAAAEALLDVPEGGTVILTTGSVSRAWISAAIGENDGPSGAAALAKAIVLARRATVVLVAEEALLAPIGRVFQAGGLAIVTLEQARLANAEASLAVLVTRPFPLTDEEGPAAAVSMLDELQPDLLISTERVGRNVNGVYYNMRGRDYGMGRARIDDLFDLGRTRGIPVVAIGDGGNEIGMGNVANQVKQHIPFGADGTCPCGGGIGAVSTADVLLTAAVSNWGCTAVVAAMAARTGDHRLLHSAGAERRLLDVMTAEGLINSTHGTIDDHVDGMAPETHMAIADLCVAITRSAFA